LDRKKYQHIAKNIGRGQLKKVCAINLTKKGTKHVAQKLFYQVWTYRDMSIVQSQLNLMSQKLVGPPSFIS
jgi:hypothetical protein